MLLQHRDAILVLTLTTTKLLCNIDPNAIIQFGSMSFNVHDKTIISSPHSSLVSNDIASSDMSHGLRAVNYYNNIKISNSDSSSNDDSTLITRKEVLLGRNVGTQVWNKKTETKEMIETFKNRQKTKEGLSFALNTL